MRTRNENRIRVLGRIAVQDKHRQETRTNTGHAFPVFVVVLRASRGYFPKRYVVNCVSIRESWPGVNRSIHSSSV
jgi:hypothetical protein